MLIYLCFIDYEKEGLRPKTKESHKVWITNCLVKILKSVEENNSARVGVEGELIHPFKLAQRIQQNCVLSLIISTHMTNES